MRAAPSRSEHRWKSTQSRHDLRRRLHRFAAMNLMPARLNGREVLLGVRPEHLEPCAESDAAFVAAVDLIEPLGADTLVHGTVEGARIVARLHGTQRVPEGRLPLRFDPAHRHYFDAGMGARIEAE